MSIVSMLSPKDRSERDYDGFSLDEMYEMGWNDLKSKLEDMDIVPVVHGHWYVYETVYEGTEAKCSICGFETLVNEPGNGLHMVGDLKYCPHCGALMDEVTE